MKRIITFTFFVISSFSVFAQNEDKSVTINTVTIQGAKVINKIDGQTIYPTEAQKNGSNNGYGILQKLMLPGIHVDNVLHTVSTVDGNVQLRINGIKVSKDEMMALDPKSISKIEFINNPGVRYGEDVRYVIDITTKKADCDYTLVADLTPTLTSMQSNGMIYGRWNKGKSELSLSYNLSGHRLKGAENMQVTDYTLNSGSIYHMERNDMEDFKKSVQHEGTLTYNWADSTATVFQASLSGFIGRTPGDYNIKSVIGSITHQESGGSVGQEPTSVAFTATNKYGSKNNSPVLDLYFFRQFTPTQSITANAVGTYIWTKANNFYDEGTPYQYDVNGKTWSILSEVIYENRLKPLTLSAGLNHSYKHTQNDYLSDVAALTKMDQHTVYGFSEIKGAWKDFRYALGAGSRYIGYKQNEHNYHFWTFRPKATLSYNIMQGMQLRYTFLLQDRSSRIAMTNDATIQSNSMERTVGNPDLKPSRDWEHTLHLSYNNSRWQTFVNTYYKLCHKPNMALYERTQNNHFIYTQINQKEIDLLHCSAYASYWIVPEKLQIMGYGGLQRCFNYGFDYTHCYSSWFYTSCITAYLGNFTLVAYTDNGNRFLEGETRGFNAGQTLLQVAYQWKDWQFSFTWANPLNPHYQTYESELINRNLHKLSTGYNRDSGNCLSINISWRIDRGKEHKSAQKTINLSDRDNGIMGK